ncbi:hypothetical protein TIFTF001_019945 [Ficus carica]|uniref:Uncharacterized protein n=1 Tax=Ficus carica TaxID=3494 RepID=A0AA88DJI1_FICCA|nr:hypothetical protein TIFTF001_019945 [Ficus carica]
MKEKKNSLLEIEKSGNKNYNNTNNVGNVASLKLPQIEVHEKGSAMEVVLITGLMDSQFMFNETIRVLNEEGADIVNASFSVTNEDTVFHTIHCKIGEFGPSPGAAARISEWLTKFVDEITKSS